MGRLLHYISLLCCAFVVIAFVLFAQQQLNHASKTQANAVSGQTTHSSAHRAGQPKRFIDDVAGKLNSPWTGIISSNNAWVRRGIPTLLSLLVYGAGLGFLARWASARPGSSW